MCLVVCHFGAWSYIVLSDHNAKLIGQFHKISRTMSSNCYFQH